jgi:hypothetical protein
MLTRVAVIDELTPAAAAWVKDLNPASGRALIKSARLIRRTALQNIQATFKRTGRNRTGTRGSQRGGQRGLKIRTDQQAGIRTVRIWHGSGILAAQELGSTVPPVTIRPVKGKVLGWGGPPGEYTRFARFVHRRGFTLRRRATLEPAYETQAAAVIEDLEQEYQKVLDTVPPALKYTVPPA